MRIKQKWCRMYMLFTVVCFQLHMSNAEPAGNALVSCTACQAITVQNFACDVNCQVVKSNEDDNFEISGLLDEMMQKINELNQSMSQEKAKVQKLKLELTEKVNQLNETLNQDKATVTKLKDSRCAFAVQGSGAEKDIDSCPIVFENVDLNTGNGYNVTTGEFNATLAGTYMLNAHVVARTNYGHFHIRKNDDVICDAWVDDDGGDVTSCTTVTYLELGDKVKVTGDDSNTATISDQHGFSGILIYPD